MMRKKGLVRRMIDYLGKEDLELMGTQFKMDFGAIYEFVQFDK